MRQQTVIVAALVAVLALPSSGFASSQAIPPKPPSNAEIKMAHELMTFKATPVFHDAKGKAITQQAFDAATKAGQRYTVKPDMQTKRFVMTLLPPGVDTPGSIAGDKTFEMTFTPSGALEAKPAPATGQPAAANQPPTIHVDDVAYKVVFRDQHDKPIALQTFAAGASQHQRYLRKLDKKTRTATLTLLPVGENAAGSKPTSRWAMLVTLLQSKQHTAPNPKLGTQFVNFDLPKVGGGRIDSSSFKGRPYVVDFFFADCVGCIEELPLLNAYHAQHPGQKVVAVTFDDAKTAAGFVKQRHFNWPVAYNGKAYDHELGIEVYPTMVVVGEDGKVLATRIGAKNGATAKSLEQWVTRSLVAAHQHATID